MTREEKKAVQIMTEQAESGSADGGIGGGGTHRGMSGLASGDIRKGAFGRKARVAAAARENRQREEAGGGGTRTADAMRRGKELKTADEIRKTRRLKAKADRRRAAAVQRKSKKNTFQRR